MTIEKLAPKSIWRLHVKSLATRGVRRGGVHVIVVIAPDETTARKMASEATGRSHGSSQVIDPYLDSDSTDCTKIGYALPETKDGVVAVDYDYDYDSVDYEWIKS